MLPERIHTYQNHTLDSTRWDRYQPRPTDIIVSTSIKSGTTWALGIVRQLIIHDLKGSHSPAISLNAGSHWLEARFQPIDDLIADFEAQQHRRMVKSHLPLDGLPFYPDVKYIVVGRDPRDVFMSLWNHHSNYTQDFLTFMDQIPGRVGDPFPPCPPNIHDFWQQWITRGWFPWESEGYPYWGNMTHTKSWWDYRDLPNVHFIHYADLLVDIEGEIQRIADFLEISLPAQVVPAISEAVTLDSMRTRASKNEATDSFVWQGGSNTFYFKGTNGRWKEVLSASELALYDEKATTLLTPECLAWLEHG